MSHRAILHSTGQESIPLLLVRSGQLTPRQCDHEFKGLTGECPTCKAMIERTDLGDGSSFASAMQALKERGQNVTYRRFSYGSDGAVEPWRVCFWAHPPGYWDGVEFKDCQKASTNAHQIHLEVIRRWYEKQFSPEKGFTIKVEQRLRRPGDPPRDYSPDLAVYGPKGERFVAVEYQRSYEAYEKFCDRDDLRRKEKWAAVDWWFDDTQHTKDKKRETVYTMSQMHRTHLARLSVQFYRCWVDIDTLELKAEFGCCGDLPPERRKRIERKIEKAKLADCSTAQIMRLLESGPEYETIKEYVEPLKAKPGSDLNFFERVSWSLERERKLAEAVIQRQRRLEEQDRRHREWETKQKLLSKLRVAVAQTAVLEDEGKTGAHERWTVEEIQKELRRIEALIPKAEKLKKEIAEWQENEWCRQKLIDAITDFGAHLEEHLDDLSTEALKSILREQEELVQRVENERREKEVAERLERERIEQMRREKELAERLERERIEQENLAEERRKREEERKQIEERRRLYEIAAQVEAAKWKPIKIVADRYGRELVLNVQLDDKIKSPYGEVQIYKGVTGAGFSTERSTYISLSGWSVCKENSK